ncbi:ribose-5-phosphate isomerase [Actinobacteria bacterium YIM 96077]|uniref:D-erythrulose 4-phosphate isomerase n=1 Tax=Phytoactinopolyspora halophila TaxID=1981511 RepID=A0A329R432_9ACTN|nr:ribose-5-phosphate isomerase [Phytoactinopolyspora halophila]AYY12020.1 ribose-5-phosphate isomerase [Actinobacteria bacterium YIM 96077]RAW18746.1 ribose-5-phosphate isomerase [Phytoactinopolyspora halophila]
MSRTWRIVVGADDAGLQLKDLLADTLRADGRVEVVTNVGVHDTADDRVYPDVGLAAAEAVARGDADRAVLVCGTGIGMAIAANKVTGVRATVAHDSYSVQRSVLSNDCQVLTLGARVVGPELARLLVSEWLGLEFDAGSASARKVAIISEFETGGDAANMCS